MNDLILIGITKLNAKIWVCDHCAAYRTPHFIYQYKQNQSITLLIERAEVLDSRDNLELKYRRDLEEFLDAKAWAKLLGVWNEHNEMKVPGNLHRPFYMNLVQIQDIASVVTKKDRKFLNGAIIYIVVDDEEKHPHFHYRFPNGNHVAISLIYPGYVAVTGRHLSENEIDKMYCFLQQENTLIGMTKYEELLLLWNEQNCTYEAASPYVSVDEKNEMPDYSRLKELN